MAAHVYMYERKAVGGLIKGMTLVDRPNVVSVTQIKPKEILARREQHFRDIYISYRVRKLSVIICSYTVVLNHSYR